MVPKKASNILGLFLFEISNFFFIVTQTQKSLTFFQTEIHKILTQTQKSLTFFRTDIHKILTFVCAIVRGHCYTII